MADYRSSVDASNEKNFGFGTVLDQANNLSKMLQQQAMPGLEAQTQEQSKEKLAQFLQNQQEQLGQRNLKTAVDTANKINSGRGMFGARASVKIGANGEADVSEQSPGQGQYFGQLAKEAKTVKDSTNKTLKPFQDQADAAKNTLDMLDQGTPQAYKLALISEAKLAAGAGGSRALKSIMDAMTGQKTANMQFGDALNFVNNTSDLTVAPAAVQQLREAVMNRVTQIQPNYQKTKKQISQGIPQLAPLSASMGNDKGLIDNSFGSIDDTFNELNKRNHDYMQSKIQQGQPGGLPPQAGYAQPQSNFDKLKSLFGFGAKPQQAPQQAQQPGASQAPSDPIADEMKRRGLSQ